MMMRIGYFTSIEGWGGSETYLLTLMKGVCKSGHTPILFGIEGTRLFREARESAIECIAWKDLSRACVDQGAGGGGKVKDEAVSCTIRAKQVFLRRMPHGLKLFAGNVREVKTLQRVFADHRVDVMHVSNSGYEVAGIACKLCNIPALVMNMITPPPEPNSIRRWLMKYTMRMYDHISSQSQNCTEAWIRLAALPRMRCSFVWNGVDLSRFSDGGQRRRNASESFRVVSVGRLHPMKGYRYLIEAVGLLADPRIRVDVYGEGGENETLRHLIHELGLEKCVFLPGYVERPEAVLGTADCFVLPSVSHESCPAVVPEAMACGLPVITSDFGPLPEVNVDGETGLVVPSGNSHALANAIKKLMVNPDLCARYGEAGKQRARDYFSCERMVGEMIKLYAEVKDLP